MSYMMDVRDDLILFGLVRNEDSENAYSILYLRYYAALKAYASLFLPQGETEDTVQSVLMDLWKKRKSIQVRESLSSYLFLSVRNRCLDTIRRDAYRSRSLSELKLSLLDEGVDFNLHNLSEIQMLIRQALEELSPEVRRTFEMSRFEGRTYQEIARETGVSVKTVEYRISQALKKLRLSLADYLAFIPLLYPLFFNQSA